MDVLGNRLKTAAIQKCFRVEFERMPLTAAKRKGYFLKSLYFINICALLTGMVIVNTKQDAGVFQCDSITVEFGNEIWEDAISLTPDGEIDRAVLVFSYFNGVYKRNGTHDGRPVYVSVFTCTLVIYYFYSSFIFMFLTRTFLYAFSLSD